MITRFGLAPLVGDFEQDFRLLRAAEAAGFESAWTNDGGSVNGYVRLAAYATQTTRLRLGTGAAIQPLRNPSVHASAAHDLSALSKGRVIIGLGSGVVRQLQRFYGVFGDAAEHPAPRMREFLTLLRQLLGGAGDQPVNFDGRFFRMNSGRTKSPPYPVPLFVAAVNRHMLNVTAELADGLIGHPITSFEYLRDVLKPTLEAGLEKNGRARSSFDLSLYILTSVNENRALARRDVAISLGFYLSPRAFDCIFEASGWEEEMTTVRQAFRTGNLENLATAVTDRMVDSCCLYGTADEVREGLKRYDGLVDQAILYSPGHLVPRERVYANFDRVVDVFGRSS